MNFDELRRDIEEHIEHETQRSPLPPEHASDVGRPQVSAPRLPHVHAPRPDIILLDLNLPRMDGREVLARIKVDDNLKLIPTVILTTSDAEADVVKSYQLQANCYLRKPVQLEAFESLIRSINDFWLTKVQLPQQAQ